MISPPLCFRGVFRLDSCAQVAEHQVLPHYVAGGRECHDGARVQGRNPDDERGVLLAHALRAFDGAAVPFDIPAEGVKENAEDERDACHHRELAAVPEFRESHFADVVAGFRQNDEHREGPHEHGVLLVFGGAVGEFRVKGAQSEGEGERDADDGLDGVEDLHGDFAELRVGAGQVAENERDREAGDQVPAQKDLEGERGRAAEHLGHGGGGVCGRAQRDDGASQKYFAREVEQFHDACDGGD